MNKIFSLTAAIIIGTGVSFAQQIPFYSQYYQNQFVLNPAFTGAHDEVNANLTHRSMFGKMPGSPVTTALTFDGPIKDKNIGLGIGLYRDVTDIVEKTGLYASYSYRMKLYKESWLNAGLSVGALDTRIDFSRAIVADYTDPMLFSQSQRKATLDAAIGLVYFWRTLEVGVGVPQIMGTNVKYRSQDTLSNFKMRQHFLASAKYGFVVNKEKEMTVSPMVVARFVKGAPFQFDFNAIYDWKKWGWLAVSYKHNYAVAVNLGVRYKSLSVGYSYDVITSPIKTYAGVGSEILLTYKFGEKKADNTKDSLLQLIEKQNQTIDEMQGKIKKLETSKVNEAPSGESQSKVSDPANSSSLATEGKNPGDASSTGVTTTPAGTGTDGSTASTSAGTSPGGTTTSDQMKAIESMFQSGKADEFKDMKGKNVLPSYYVVIGTYKSKDNAESVVKQNNDKGYVAEMIINKATNVFYVTILNTDNKNDAKSVAEKIRGLGYPDAWVQSLE